MLRNRNLSGETMEIAIHQVLDVPFLEVTEGEKQRFHVPLGMMAKDIIERFGSDLEPHQIDDIQRLLTDDSTKREFEQFPDFLLVKLAS